MIQPKSSPPVNEALTDPKGQTSQAWARFFQKIANAALSAPGALIGDYRQSANADLGPNWLVCLGSEQSDAKYPVLSALLKPITGPGTAANTFLLPNIPPLTQPAPNNTLVYQYTYIRAV